ncbi:alpha/beta hydrolase [Ostreiculturibacter nitratireducens]|uniref:alpha/beta hydrolase n=1 Tax=Ostreiculturibacter nitratireducens TaxID=3075226 RepID=UPI0031B62F46
MKLLSAPFFQDIAKAPEGGEAFWITTEDRVRIRVAAWGKGNLGTVFLFPGRTEYVEKYGPPAAEFAARGYATIVVDWRGQGLADRPLPDRETGHVSGFADYQMDVAAVEAVARELGLPEPFFLVAHSMGGAIAFRSLIEGRPFRAAAFSAPMWGIKIAPTLRPVAWVLAATSRRIGQAHRYAPGTGPVDLERDYVFEGNTLTTDPEMFAFQRRQVEMYPELALGGPSLHWLHEALRETRGLRALPSPEIPVLTALGTNERVVEPRNVHDRMQRWPKGRFNLFEGAEHEMMMERPEVRTEFYDQAAELFDLPSRVRSRAS